MVGPMLVVLLSLAAADPRNMNEGGVPYAISNPAQGSTPYSTNFQTNVEGPVEHFDVYGEVQTIYSQVYWTRNTPIPLPLELVERFTNGGVMAITGYEVDQVTHEGAPPPSSPELGGFACYPDCDLNDTSVPIYHAYNHHYFGWLLGKGAELYTLDEPTRAPNPTRTAVREVVAHPGGYPTNIVFKENPGGEYRKSYHGYPSGYAQLLAEPTTWVVEPMQIDTHHRGYPLTQPVGYQPWHLPRQSSNRTETQLGGGASPLLECPCTDRITRVRTRVPALLTGNATCDERALPTEAACTATIAEFAAVASSSRVSNASLPSGCLVLPAQTPGEGTRAVFNTASASAATCTAGGGRPLALGGGVLVKSLQGTEIQISIDHDGVDATIYLSGPAGAWFGVGLAAHQMADAPYALIVDGAGDVTERRLADHAPGDLLAPSIRLVSSTATDGTRRVMLTRKVAGATPRHLSLPTAAGQLDVIVAVGSTPSLSYHKAHATSQLVLLPTSAAACVCAPRVEPFLVYNHASRVAFGYECKDEPRGDMLRRGDGTGRHRQNAACDIRTYHGGLECCKHGFLLTDEAQQPLIKPHATDRYYLKWRYYFQTYRPAGEGRPASHVHLHHWVFLIDAEINDYEEENAAYGTASVGKITAHLSADMLCSAGCDSGSTGVQPGPDRRLAFKTITSLVMTPHCHAPSCLREELWNADTGELLCNVTARYGDAAYGSLDAPFNERDYVAIPPCLWGQQPGLRAPFSLTPDTNLTAIKYFNNTFRHLGQMAQWTGLAVYQF